MMTARIYPTTGGYGWLLFRGPDCVGSSENPSKSCDNAIVAARRWAKKYGYGPVTEIKLPAAQARGLEPETVGDQILKQYGSLPLKDHFT